MKDKSRILLDVKNISLNIQSANGELAILDNINFQIAKGQSLALLGKSGSGKSILALSILQAFRYQSTFKYQGKMSWDGAQIQGELFSLSQKLIEQFRSLEIAYISQESQASMNPSYKVKYQIEQTLKLIPHFKKSDYPTLIEDCFKGLGLNDISRILNSYPHQLSGGQLQRINIAMALLRRPEMIIFDEPCSSLDIIRRNQILNIISEIKKEATTSIIYITHDISMIEDWVDHIVVLEEGRVSVQGAYNSSEVLAHSSFQKMKMASKPVMKDSDQIRPGEQPIFSIEKLKVFYPAAGGKWKWRPVTINVVEEVSFDLFKGQCIGICGMSGSGKSTLINAISGLHNLWTGRMLFEQKELNTFEQRSSKQKRKIQLVMQNSFSSLNPSMKIRSIFKEIFRIHGRLNGLRSIEENTIEILEKVQLTGKLLDRFPSELSGGQRQRINLARALAHEPDILICDESVSSLDKITQLEILDLLHKFKREQHLSILFISHDYKAVSYIANEILIIEEGVVLQRGTQKMIHQNPANAYVKQLIGAMA